MKRITILLSAVLALATVSGGCSFLGVNPNSDVDTLSDLANPNTNGKINREKKTTSRKQPLQKL